MAIVVRTLKEGEIELANKFFNDVYKVNRSLENFAWEFLEGPNGPAVYVIAIDDSVDTGTKVVGIQAAIPMHLYNTNGETILTAKSEDTLVDPGYRGQNIFERMYDLLFQECKKAGIEYIWGFTPAKKAFDRIGFQIPFQAHQALMVFDSVKAYSHLSSLNPKNRGVDKAKIAGLTLLSKLLSIFKGVDPSLQVRAIRDGLESKDEAIAELCPASSLFFLKMNNRYIEWRIKNNPFGNQYESYQFSSGGALLADVILNFRPEGFGYIEQVVFKDNLSEKLKRQVLLHVIKIMKLRVSFIRALCFDTNDELRLQSSLFERTGFMVLKRGSYFVWRATSDGALRPHDIFLSRLFTQGNQ